MIEAGRTYKLPLASVYVLSKVDKIIVVNETIKLGFSKEVFDYYDAMFTELIPKFNAFEIFYPNFHVYVRILSIYNMRRKYFASVFDKRWIEHSWSATATMSISYLGYDINHPYEFELDNENLALIDSTHNNGRQNE